MHALLELKIKQKQKQIKLHNTLTHIRDTQKKEKVKPWYTAHHSPLWRGRRESSRQIPSNFISCLYKYRYGVNIINLKLNQREVCIAARGNECERKIHANAEEELRQPIDRGGWTCLTDVMIIVIIIMIIKIIIIIWKYKKVEKCYIFQLN